MTAQQVIGSCLAYIPMSASLLAMAVTEKYNLPREWVVPAVFLSFACFVVGLIVRGNIFDDRPTGKPVTLGLTGNGRQGNWQVEIEEVYFADPVTYEDGVAYNKVLETPNYLIVENSTPTAPKRYEITLSDNMKDDIDDLIAALQAAKKDFEEKA